MNKALEAARALVKMLEEQENETKAGVELSELQPGERFETELGKFIVLDQDREHGQTKVIQDNFYTEDVKFGNVNDYKKSELKDLFDGEITEAYEKVFGEALVEHTVQIKSVDNQDYGEVTCKVRPVTFDEAREYNKLLVNKSLPDWWWTCSPWSSEDRGWKYSVAVVSSGGVIFNCYYYILGGVRPFCILKSNLFVSKVEE